MCMVLCLQSGGKILAIFTFVRATIIYYYNIGVFLFGDLVLNCNNVVTITVIIEIARTLRYTQNHTT